MTRDDVVNPLLINSNANHGLLYLSSDESLSSPEIYSKKIESRADAYLYFYIEFMELLN